MIDIHATEARLRDHLKVLTVDIGERSVRVPGNLKKAAGHIRDFYRGIGIEARLEPYDYHGVEVANVVAEVPSSPRPARRILIGAHYDSVAGTVGADDNASAVAVQIETARQVMALKARKDLDAAVVFVSFALEEPPAYGTRHMGSRVYADQARRRNERIDAMLCLEMVGYTCSEPSCQSYPFPLMFFGYPKEGNFIGIVGNFDSRGLTRSIFEQLPEKPGPAGNQADRPLQRLDHAGRAPERPRLLLGRGLQGRDDHGLGLLPQPPLPPAFGYDGQTRLPVHGRAGGEPCDVFGSASLNRSLRARPGANAHDRL